MIKPIEANSLTSFEFKGLSPKIISDGEAFFEVEGEEDGAATAAGWGEEAAEVDDGFG